MTICIFSIEATYCIVCILDYDASVLLCDQAMWSWVSNPGWLCQINDIAKAAMKWQRASLISVSLQVTNFCTQKCDVQVNCPRIWGWVILGKPQACIAQEYIQSESDY